MNFRKLTSLLMMIGLMMSLFHPLAHAGTPDNHGGFNVLSQSGSGLAVVAGAQTLVQTGHAQDPISGHSEDGFVTNHCETCHVFAHIFTISSAHDGLPISRMLVLAGMVAFPVTADVLRFDRPPRAFV